MKPRRGEQGNIAIEFALILPLLLLIVGGIIDFGRAYWFQQTLTWASREGARQGSILNKDNWNLSLVKGKVVDSVKDGCGATITAGDVTVSPETGPAGGTELTVSVTMPFSFMIIPYSINNLTGQTIMRFESS